MIFIGFSKDFLSFSMFFYVFYQSVSLIRAAYLLIKRLAQLINVVYSVGKAEFRGSVGALTALSMDISIEMIAFRGHHKNKWWVR